MRTGFFRWFGAAKGRGSGYSLMTVGNLLAAFLTYARQAAIAKIFGATWLTDTFAVAQVFPVLVREIIAHTVGAIFLPVYSDVVINKGPETARRLVSRLLTWIAIFGVIVSVLMILARHELISIIGPGLSLEGKALASTMLVVMVPILVLSTLSGVLQGLCDFERRYGLTALIRFGDVVISLSAIIILSGPLGIMSLPVSVLAGAAGTFILLLAIVKSLRFRYGMELSLADPDFLRMLRNSLPILAGATLGLLAPVVDKVLASYLAESSVTALDYASKIVNLIFMILLMPLITLTNVQLSAFSAKNDMRAFSREFRTMLNWNSAMMVPGSVILAVLAVPLVSVLFQRGEFTHWDSELVGGALLFYAPWLMTFSTNSILNRSFFALGDTLTPVLISVWGMLVNVMISIILIVPMGIGGLALGTSLASFGKTILMVYFFRKKTGPIGGRVIAVEQGKILISAMIMAVVVIRMKNLIPFEIAGDIGLRVMSIALRLAASVLVYLLVMLLLRSEVIGSVGAQLRSKRPD